MILQNSAKLVHSAHSNYNTNTITYDFKDQNALRSYCFVNTLSLESDEDMLILWLFQRWNNSNSKKEIYLEWITDCTALKFWLFYNFLTNYESVGMVCEKGTTYLTIQDVEMQIINQKVDEIKIRILTWCMDRCSWEWENIFLKVYQM